MFISLYRKGLKTAAGHGFKQVEFISVLLKAVEQGTKAFFYTRIKVTCLKEEDEKKYS